ncbi:hypothetical protein M3182_04530 [Mesobacillus maritimus]|uniref:hypothetical protein n=1 Tax=Mesobacillus maritimus TaxID=1643336 RepID=UPI002041876F|nr:hypothetical protein [Mesobacillus maritimus]MCM3585012.1 hypothetical protein [Mesobacillus maritimus]
MIFLHMIKEWIVIFWDWFWYFRRGKVKYRVFDLGGTFNATASNGKVAVWNCYGSSPEAAKAMAQYQLRIAYKTEKI